MSSQSQDCIYYMYGRFQPFTLGHLSLFEIMVESLSQLDGVNHAYLFVSHSSSKKSKAPKNTAKIKSIIDGHRSLVSSEPSNTVMSEIKKLLKSKNSILDSPLSSEERMRIICYVLGLKDELSYKMPEVVFTSGSVTCHVINCQTNTSYTSLEGSAGFFKAHRFLETKYPSKSVSMFSGNDRKIPEGISSILTDRNNRNSTASGDATKMSGSKIRSYALFKMTDMIHTFYGKRLTKSEVKQLIIAPLYRVILGMDLSISESSSSLETKTSIKTHLGLKKTKKNKSKNKKSHNKNKKSRTKLRHIRLRSNRLSSLLDLSRLSMRDIDD